MIEQSLEQAVVAKIAALNLPALKVDGVLAPAAEGAVKGAEGADFAAFAKVAASLRAFETFSHSKADVAIRISLSIRADLAPDGAALVEYTEPLQAILDEWQLSIDCVHEDLSVEGFNPVGVRVDGGDVSLDREAGVWRVEQSLTVRGIVQTQTTTTNERN